MTLAILFIQNSLNQIIPMIYGQLVAKTHHREPKDINVPS